MPTISPISPPIADTTSTVTASFSTSQPQQLRGPSSPKSYNRITRTSYSHSYQGASMDYTPDKNFSRSLITATLCLAWIFITAVALLLLYWLRRIVKRRKALDSAVTVRSYLKRFDQHDFRVLKSSLGGWHVVFGRRLANRVRYYWTNELPGADEASTILFDDDHTLPSHHIAHSQSSDHELSSCGSLSSEDQGVRPHPKTIHSTCRRGQILSFQAISFQEAQDLANPGAPCRFTSSTQGISGRPSKQQIQSFIHRQFPSDKILLSESHPAGGFSVIYCNRLDNNQAMYAELISISPTLIVSMIARNLFFRTPLTMRRIQKEL